MRGEDGWEDMHEARMEHRPPGEEDAEGDVSGVRQGREVAQNRKREYCGDGGGGAEHKKS